MCVCVCVCVCVCATGGRHGSMSIYIGGNIASNHF